MNSSIAPKATIAALLLILAGPAESAEPSVVSTGQFLDEATSFLEQEIAAHVAAVKQLDPPQETVLGVPTAGDFTWGTFMRAVKDCSALTGQRTIAGRNVPEFLGKVGLIESRLGGKTFSQLGAALTLKEFGTDLRTNALWQSLSPSGQAEWRALLDPGRFYDRKTRQVIDLPENYFGVAARIVAMDFEMGLITDRSFADDVLERAAGQFLDGALYADDSLPTGRYDRYSQEYARFVYSAARTIGRKDIQAAVEPSLKAVMQTWWDLVSPDGCGYPWGRTIGAISYMDTMEITAFLAEHPELRPAPLPELASVYHAAWQWLQQDYERDHHLLNMFGFGRGNYHYLTPARRWQQTCSYLGKAADSLKLMTDALKAENIASFPAQPHLPEVARFEWFRKGDRPAGVWLVRRGALRFALPITTGPLSGIADYLAAPHALPGFAAPVQQLVPALVPYLELADGTKIVAGDGADEIYPGNDGRSLRVVWKRWAVVGEKPIKFVEPGLTSEVVWRIEDGALVRSEMVMAAQPVTVKRFSVTFPTTCDQVETRWENRQRVYHFSSAGAALAVSVNTGDGLSLSDSLQATGNSAAGKGARGPIPLLLNLDASDLRVTSNAPLNWTIRIRMTP